MKFLPFFLIITSCSYLKDIEIEDTYPVAREYQLASQQGKFNSINKDFDLDLSILSSSKEKTKDKTEPLKHNQEKDIFIVALDYISEKYPIKDVNTADKIIITDFFDDNQQITIFAKSFESFKVNGKNKILSEKIQQEISKIYDTK